MAIAVWVGYPRSYTAGRNRPPQYVVVHYTAGSEGPTSAENGAAYDKTRTDGTSTHTFADSDSVVREVPDGDRAHAARWHGNEIGLQLELCGTAQTREQWLDDVSRATLRNGARQTAEWCRDHGLPPRRLSVAQTRAAYYASASSRPKGIVGHVDVTYAYPEDGGDHVDPGAGFPWDVFLAMVAEELGDPTNGDDDMADSDLVQGEAWRMDALTFGADEVRGGPTAGEPMWLVLAVKALQRDVADIKALLAAGGGLDGPSLAQIAAAVRAELDRTNLDSVPGHLVAD